MATDHKKAMQAANIVRPTTPHNGVPEFSTHFLQAGYDVRTVQICGQHTDVLNIKAGKTSIATKPLVTVWLV